MEAPGPSGRSPAGFASLAAWPLSYNSPAVSGRQQEPFVSQPDGSSQQSSAVTRVPVKAWLPSFGRGNSGSNRWSSRPFSHKPSAIGLGTGAGGSMLVSTCCYCCHKAAMPQLHGLAAFLKLCSLASAAAAAVWWIWCCAAWWFLVLQKQRYTAKLPC